MTTITMAVLILTTPTPNLGVDGMLNPYINYPFDDKATARLASYSAKAHAAGLKLKMYYTIRELTPNP